MNDEIKKLRDECKRLARAYAEARIARHCDEEKDLAIAVEVIQASKAVNGAVNLLAALCADFEDRAELAEQELAALAQRSRRELLTEERVVSVLRNTPGWGVLDAQELAAVIVEGIKSAEEPLDKLIDAALNTKEKGTERG